MTTFFESNVALAQMRIQDSCETFDGTFEEWEASEHSQTLQLQAVATKKELSKWNWYKEQVQQLKAKVGDLYGDFRNLWKTSSMGWELQLIRHTPHRDGDELIERLCASFESYHEDMTTYFESKRFAHTQL